MEKIIKQLLNESGYRQRNETISFFEKENKSFFFIVNISELDFASLKNKDLIKENKQYKVIMDGFTEIVNGGDQITIEKNSSLIVLVNCTSINAINTLQQQILLFEEDPYFFKKYVILYTDDSIRELNTSPLIPTLTAKVNNTQTFNNFAQAGYQENISEYITIMQLFIKLPFLNLTSGIEAFTSLSQKIVSALDMEAPLHSSILSRAEELGQIDFSRPEDEASINDLLSILPHD